jgi:hypothetical protein
VECHSGNEMALVEARVLLIRHPTAPLKALDDVVLYAAESGDVLSEHRHVVGGRRTGQTCGMLCR